MQKAKYMERQPEVRWQPVNNGMVDVTLCLNEQKVTIEQGQMEDSAKQMMYEYDYHQFRESADKINEETVRASPAKYMSYVPEVEKSLERNCRLRTKCLQVAFLRCQNWYISNDETVEQPYYIITE